MLDIMGRCFIQAGERVNDKDKLSTYPLKNISLNMLNYTKYINIYSII